MILRLAARDPGGANVLTAFLDRARTKWFFTPDVWAMSKAADVFERAGVSVRLFADGVTPDELHRQWNRAPADLLITGTSHHAPFETALWDIARLQGCPSLALMDQWCNLRVRFRHGWPDYVGAIDAAQSDALARLGFAGENVLVVGHPWLAELVESRAAHTATPKTPRDRDAVCVLFVSENIAEDVANGRNAPFGFDEIDSFDVLYRAASAAAELGTKVSVAVKCHAYEDPARFRKYLEGLTPPPLMRVASVPPGGNPRAWVLWSDLIVGISSMLLLEAMVLDRPVISVQPGLQRENTFQAGVNGYARTLTDPAEAVSVMTQMIRDPEERRVALDGHRKFTDTLERDCVEPVLRWIRSRATRHA